MVMCEIQPDETHGIQDEVKKMEQSSLFKVSISDINSSHRESGLVRPRLRHDGFNINPNVISLRFHTVAGIEGVQSEETTDDKEVVRV